MKTARNRVVKNSKAHWFELLVKPGKKVPEVVPLLADSPAAMTANIGFLEDLRKMSYPSLTKGQKMLRKTATLRTARQDSASRHHHEPRVIPKGTKRRT